MERPVQSWRTFLKNHASEIAAIHFFVVPTITFRLLYVFIVVSHDRRHVLRFNVTESPSACWAGQQIIEAFPYETAPKYLLRDRDGIYGKDFVRRVRSMGIKQILSATWFLTRTAACILPTKPSVRLPVIPSSPLHP